MSKKQSPSPSPSPLSPFSSSKSDAPRFCLQDTGNKVARKATLVGTQNIMLGGKTVIMQDAMIRGDLARTALSSSAGGSAPASNTAVAIGRYCFLSKGCCLRPPGRMYKGCVRSVILRATRDALPTDFPPR